MKIKKVTPLTALIIALLMAIPSMAQGPFVHLNAGYGLPLAGQSLTGTDHEVTSGSDNTTYKTVRYSVGYGLNYAVGGGYMFNKNIGLGLDLNFLMASSPTASVSKTVVDSVKLNDELTEKWTVFQLRVIPNIVFSSPIGDKMSLYGRIGIVLGFATHVDLTFEDKASSPAGNQSMTQTLRYSGNTPIGMFGALGYGYNFTDKFGVFGEITCIAMNYAPAKSVLTAYSLDGSDKLSTLKTREKETDYNANFTVSGKTAPDENSPSVASPTSYPFSSFGLNLGLRMRF